MEQLTARLPSIDIFPWDDNFNTGIASIDEQHKKLVALLNVLASHIAFKSDNKRLEGIFDELVDYTRYHFETEEAIWHTHLAGDALEVSHQDTHRGFIETVLRLKSEQATRPLEELAEEALGFLARWLAAHILETDRYMAYIVLAMENGMPPDMARQDANAKMSGATRVLISIILSIYESLSTNTLQLMREIAERKRREVDLIQARLQAEAANIAKSQFLGNMGHEVRTPLHGILGMAQLLRHDNLGDEERREFTEAITQSGKQLLALCDNLLSLSRVESGMLTLEPGPFEPRALMREIQEQFSEPVKTKGLLLETSVEEWVAPRYVADVQRLRQMLGNLISNAIKFTESGRIRLAVREIFRDDKTAELEFSVTDTGIGVDAGRQHLLFQPFSQLDSSHTRQHGGTGIGLSVVRNLAELMGGTVGIESKEGQGSRFWFTVHLALT